MAAEKGDCLRFPGHVVAIKKLENFVQWHEFYAPQYYLYGSKCKTKCEKGVLLQRY